MTRLISGKTAIEIEPVKITLKTFPKLKEMADNVRSLSKPDQSSQIKRGLSLLAQMPGLADFITPDSSLNPDTLKRETERLGSMEAAQRYMIGELHAVAAQNPELALELFFPAVELGPDIATITACIEVVRSTYNPSTLDKKELALVESDLSSEFWQNVESEGVLEYCVSFCKEIK